MLALHIMNLRIAGWISASNRQGDSMAEQVWFEEEEERGEDKLLPTDPCSSLGSFQEEHDCITTLIVIILLIFPTVKQGVCGQ